jgi:hypothetical protein
VSPSSGKSNAFEGLTSPTVLAPTRGDERNDPGLGSALLGRCPETR